MPRVRGSSVRLIVVGTLIALAGICYSSWVLEFVWPSPLDPLRSFLSELDAENRPHRIVYVAGDVITASTAMAAAALMLLPRPLVSSWWGRGAGVALLVFGASTIADALLPIECIPHVDPDCPAEPSGLLPQLHHIHALTSTIAVFAIFAVMILGVIAAHRSGIWPVLRRWGLVVLVIVAAATAWMLAADNVHGDFRLGLAQRIQVGGMTLWMVLWGAAVIGQIRRDRHRRRRRRAITAPSPRACPNLSAGSI